jgi:hypothetical protein
MAPPHIVIAPNKAVRVKDFKIIFVSSQFSAVNEQRVLRPGCERSGCSDHESSMIDGLSTKIDGLPTKIDGLSTKIDGLSTKIDGLS